MAEGRDITAEVKRIIKEQLDVDEADIKAESTFIDDLARGALARHVGDDDVGSLTTERLGGRAPDAARASSHERYFSS